MLLPKPLKKLKNGLEDILPFDTFTKPIFIISPPRSGSTFLFDCLIQFRELFHISYEADLIWWNYFPYSRLKDSSDYIGADEATDVKVYDLKRALRARASLNMIKLNRKASHIPSHLGIKPIQYIDKTISNCFHLDFLNKAFPDAQYIFLLRDPRAVVSSMIEGWGHAFQKPQLTHELNQLSHVAIKHWTYPAPPGWQEHVSGSLENICAWSWMQHIEYSLSYFNNKNVHTLRYEDLVNDTSGSITTLANELDLKITDEIRQYLVQPRVSRTTVSTPEPDKWKHKNKKEIESIMPMIEGLAKKIGYDF